MKGKTWIVSWLILVILTLSVLASWVYKIDPYMHYHKPDTSKYYYILDNERSQNDGIVRHFDYDAIITGTSMTENFRTTQMDEIFGVNSIKVSFSGASYKEINDNLVRALESNSDIKIIVRGLDYGRILDDKDIMRNELGNYPTYLYDDNLFNDVNYVFNKDVIFGRAYMMTVANDEEGFVPGITSFDDYARWQEYYSFGKKTVIQSILKNVKEKSYQVHLSDDKIENHLSLEEKEIIKGNITQNVTELADKYPNVDFYYFFTPYSIMYWRELVMSGEIYRQIEAEQYVIELILEHENIHLFSFNNRTDITTDLNNYKDIYHYGEWINTIILNWMYRGEYLLTKDNYIDYLADELSFYTEYDYDSLINQADWINDYYAAALLNYEVTGEEPIDLLESDIATIELSGATIVDNQYDGKRGILCVGRLPRTPGSAPEVFQFVRDTAYVGAKINLQDIGHHNYLVFYGKKIKDDGELLVFVYNENLEKERELVARYYELDEEWHQYVIDLTDIEGDVTIVLNGGYRDTSGDMESTFVFSNIMLY